jgi:hypothetical protein
MLVADLEKLIESSGYDMVVFPTSSLPDDTLEGLSEYLGSEDDIFTRYAPQDFSSEDSEYNFDNGWLCTPYDYSSAIDYGCNILIVDYQDFVRQDKKRRLLKAIKCL